MPNHTLFSTISTLMAIVLILSSFQFERTLSTQICDVVAFGARGDSSTDNTLFIQRAIDSCTSYSEGGMVVFPDNSGTYLSGAVFLDNNIEFHVGQGTTLKAIFTDWSSTWQHFPLVYARSNGKMRNTHAALVNGGKCLSMKPGQSPSSSGAASSTGDQCQQWKKISNVTISGSGSIDGSGENWWPFESKTAPDNGDNDQRPSAVRLLWVTNLVVTDVHIMNSAFWSFHVVFCTNVVVRNVDVTAPANSPNTDGCDIDSTSKVLVTDSTFAVGDDCVAIDSGTDQDGRLIGIPSSDVIVQNCQCIHSHGFSIGSQMSGNVTNVLFRNLTVIDSQFGVRIKSQPGRGGWVQHVRFQDIAVRNITSTAIEINMQWSTSDSSSSFDSPTTPHLVDVSVLRVAGTIGHKSAFAFNLFGLTGAPIQQLFLKDINLQPISSKINFGPFKQCSGFQSSVASNVVPSLSGCTGLTINDQAPIPDFAIPDVPSVSSSSSASSSSSSSSEEEEEEVPSASPSWIVRSLRRSKKHKKSRS